MNKKNRWTPGLAVQLQLQFNKNKNKDMDKDKLALDLFNDTVMAHETFGPMDMYKDEDKEEDKDKDTTMSHKTTFRPMYQCADKDIDLNLLNTTLLLFPWL